VHYYYLLSQEQKESTEKGGTSVTEYSSMVVSNIPTEHGNMGSCLLILEIAVWDVKPPVTNDCYRFTSDSMHAILYLILKQDIT